MDDDGCLFEPVHSTSEERGGKRRTDMRAVMNGVMYNPEHWLPMALPSEGFPPRSTVHNIISWQVRRRVDRINHATLREMPTEGGTRRQPHRLHHR